VSAAAPAGGVDRARRIQQLFDGALEIDESRRATFLAGACGEDLDLRAEVEALLASLGRARTHDILPPLLAGDGFPATELPDPSTSLVGLRIHNYQVDAAIGSGGMAEVYVAHHLVFPRKAALKVLQEHFSRNPDIVQRFINEARAANAIHHPSIIEVIDAGRLDGSGAPYILMEYLEGESLGACLRAGRLPIRESIRITIETAEAVAAAHDKGIVHRDLKPENIFLVRREGAPPLVKVLDFGIAKLRTDVASTLATTQVGMIMGTPQYMSPEQCRDASGVDHRTDIYSLGVILYEMACGRPPFQSAAGFTDLVFSHVAVAPEAPRKLAADLPVAVESVILRCLAKSADERYPSMRELVAALRAALPESGNGPAVMAVAAATAPPAARALPRSRRGLVAAAAFSVAALVGVGLAVRARHVGDGTPAESKATVTVTIPAATTARPVTPPTVRTPEAPRDDRERPPNPTAAAAPARTVVQPTAADEARSPRSTPATRSKRHDRRKDIPESPGKEAPEVLRKDIPASLGTNPY
jgi:tRNA A-37 threonylcarbamoyl transferase component Bud32